MVQEETLPLFLDIHSIGTDLNPEAIHPIDDEPQPGARCLRHWVNASGGRMFCLIEADDAGLAARVHTAVAGIDIEGCHPVSEYA